MRRPFEAASSTIRRLARIPWRREAALVVAYFSVLTIMTTWPLALRTRDSFVGQSGDNYYFLWEIGWVQKALFELHVPPTFAPNVNYPQGWNLAYADMAPLTIATALPGSLLGGPVLGYNSAILLTYVMSGLTMYLWVRRLTQRPFAGLIAGTLFAFSPYRFAHYLAGHLELMGTEWLPLYFMGLSRTLLGKEESRKALLLTGGSLALVALTSLHYLYLSLVMTSVLSLAAWVFFHRSRSAATKLFLDLGTVGLVALPVIVVVISPYIDLARQADLPVRSIEYVRQFSASPTDFVLPATFHPIWGKWIGDHFDRSYWMEATLYVGIVGVFLAAAGFAGSKRLGVERGVLVLLCLTALIGFVLALGINLQWLSKPVIIDTPRFLQRLHPSPQARIPLPGYFLFKYLPYYSSMRVWMRFGVFVLLGASALAGIGSAALAERLKGRWRYLALLGITALVLFDFWPKRQPFTRVETQPVDLWLVAQPGTGAVAPFPFSAADSQELQYRTLIHGKPFVGGHYGTYATPQFMRIGPVLDGFPSEESVSVLRELGVQYVLVSSSAYPHFEAINDRIELLGLERLTTVGETVVYELR